MTSDQQDQKKEAIHAHTPTTITTDTENSLHVPHGRTDKEKVVHLHLLKMTS